MECNRDEAARAKEIAQKKFQAKDIKGAKKFALKAKNLNPELEGISQMVMTLDVYISAEDETVHGESNWYGILGVTPLADDETIRKQYRKLALVLHPDKNRCIGAEGAFQLVSQAWSLLSDKSKKKEYDQKCRANTNGVTGQNGFHNMAKTAAASKSSVPKGKNYSAPGPYKKEKSKNTFWTVCHGCKMQFEYLRMYLNQNLLCPNCREAYYAVEIAPPSQNCSRTTFKTKKNTSHHQGNSNFQWAPFSDSSTATASAVQAANMVKQAYEKVKMERQKAKAASRREEALRRKNLSSKRKMGGGESSGHSNALKKRKGFEHCGESGGTNFSDLKQDGLQESMNKDVGIKQMMMDKASEELRKKLNEHTPSTIVKKNTEENEIVKKEDNFHELVETKCLDMSVNIPEPDFHDFDKDRSENCFRENQVWAVYDDDDGMPRHYAMIHDVISLNPFKVSISWLKSLTNTRSGHVSWFQTNSSKTCGEFGKKTGRIEIFNSLESFSHKIRFSKCTSRTIEIFPRKGDVWALYRNWSSEWNELTEDEVIHKYEMVEVLEDYEEDRGVIVIPLVKVAGFKGVFHQHFDPMEIKRIPNEEMSRFSHQVPSFSITGREGSKSKSLEGCLELDPAATPLEILELVIKNEEIEFFDNNDEDVELNDRDENTDNIIELVENGEEFEFVKVDEFVENTDNPLESKG